MIELGAGRSTTNGGVIGGPPQRGRAIRRWIATLTSAVLAASALVAAAPSAWAATIIVNCSANPAALGPAIAAASTGDTLDVIGTCQGEYSINKALTLAGTSPVTVLHGDSTGPVITVTGTGNLTLERLTVTGGGNGASSGGGIRSLGVLKLDQVTVSGNTARFGGGIQQLAGQVSVNGSTISNNSVTSSGAGIHISSGTLTVNNSTISHGTASFYGGGLGVDGGQVTLRGSTIANNTAVRAGGINFDGGTVTLETTTVTNNSASSGNGGAIGNFSRATLTLEGSTVSSNRAANLGGGIYNTNGSTTVVRTSHITGNSASNGGGIYNDSGTVSLEQATVTGNTPNNCAPAGSVPGCSG